MRSKLRSRAGKRSGVIGLLTLVVLALVPMAPAAAVQTISWTTSPPTTAVVGQQVSFTASGTANTFLGARITGCFVNFPDGNNYTNSYGGNFTIGTCSYSNRTLTTPGAYTITIGFSLSTGSTMSLTWTVNVSAPTPTVSVPSSITKTATSVEGVAVTFAASATDSYYGASSATCSPASGSVFPVGTTAVSCSATNAGGKTGSASFPVTVEKASPTLLWSPPSPVPYGTTYGDLMTAAMQATDATGTITYSRGDSTEPAPGDLLPVGADQVLTATYVPTGPAASAYRPVAVNRTVSVERAASAVAFDSETPTSAQFGDAAFSVDVEGTAGAGDVTVSAQTGSTCTVSSPSTGTSVTATVTITGAGDCVLFADQAATNHYTAAPTAQWSVTASKANPEITWTPPSVLTYGDPVSDLFDATADTPGTMTYLIDGAELAPGTVLDAGVERVVSVVFTPDRSADYTDATAIETFTVVPAPQTLTVADVDDQIYGNAPFILDVGGHGPGAVSATATGDCSVDELTVTVTNAGSCEVTVAKAATNNYTGAESVTRAFTIKRAPQTLTVGAITDKTYGAALFDLDIDGTGPGVVTATATGACTVAGLKVTVESAGDCTITVAKAATNNYTAAPAATRTFTIDPATQTLTVGAIADKTYGADPFNLDIDGTGPGVVTATATGACTVAGLRVTLERAGQCSVTVSKAAAASYSAAQSVTRTFTVNPAPVASEPPAMPAAPGPVIVTTSPNSGPTKGKTAVTITGTDFTGATSVNFGAVDARFTVKSSTTIVATSPALKKGAYDIRVTTAHGTSAQVAADRYTVRPVPKVTKASGKKSVTIRGTGFTGATSVKFGKVAVTFKVKNDTTIVVTSPRLKKGKYDVRVTTSGGTSTKVKADRYVKK